MAQHKSAEKRHRQNERRKARNKNVRSRMRNAMKDARSALEHQGATKAEDVKAAVSEITRAASRNVITKATASRYVSRLMHAAAKA